MASTSNLEATVNKLQWFHSIDFGNGIVSPGAKTLDILAEESDCFFGSVSLAGKTFLDIGTYNGAHAFEAKRRGAARVLATDEYMWRTAPSTRAAFDLARKHIAPDMEDVMIDIPQITKDRLGTFDVVLFAGIFYHLFEAPRLLLQIADVASQLLIVETHQDMLDTDRPAMAYYPGATLNNDASNFWGPNPPLMFQLLREAGFSEVYYRPHPNGHQRGRYLAFRNLAAASVMQFKPTLWRDLNKQPAIDRQATAKEEMPTRGPLAAWYGHLRGHSPN